MKKSIRQVLTAVAIVATLLSATTSFAVIIASDNASASNGAYDDGWQTGDNGGTGFSAWTLQNAGTDRFFITTSTVNGNGDGNADGDIDTPDRPADQDGSNNAWGMRDNGGGATQDAIRDFNVDLSQNYAYRFDVEMDNGFMDTGGGNDVFGLSLQNKTSGLSMFEFFFEAGDTVYTYVDETGQHASTLGFTDEGLHLTFLITGTDSYSATFSNLNTGANQTVSGDLGGTDGQAVNRFRGFYFAASGDPADPSNIGFFNSMEITAVPEPSTVLLFVAGAGIIYGNRRRFFKRR